MVPVALWSPALLPCRSSGRVTVDTARPPGSTTLGNQWISTDAGVHLRGRRTRDTAPELALRRAVHALGLRFRLHQSVAQRCTPDFVLPRWRLAVFVDGCFWHGCTQHGPKRFRGPNAELWRAKIATNQARDERSTLAAREAGWTVLRVWECDVRRDVRAVAKQVADVARQPTTNG